MFFHIPGGHPKTTAQEGAPSSRKICNWWAYWQQKSWFTAECQEVDLEGCQWRSNLGIAIDRFRLSCDCVCVCVCVCARVFSHRNSKPGKTKTMMLWTLPTIWLDMIWLNWIPPTTTTAQKVETEHQWSVLVVVVKTSVDLALMNTLKWMLLKTSLQDSQGVGELASIKLHLLLHTMLSSQRVHMVSWAPPPSHEWMNEWMNEWMGRWNAARGFLSDILTPIHTLSSAIIYRHNMSVVLCSLTHRKYAGGNWLPLVDYFCQSKFPPAFAIWMLLFCKGTIDACGSWWFRIGVQDFLNASQSILTTRRSIQPNFTNVNT